GARGRFDLCRLHRVRRPPGRSIRPQLQPLRGPASARIYANRGSAGRLLRLAGICLAAGAFERTKTIPPGRGRGGTGMAVTFERVTYSFPRQERPAIADANAEIPVGAFALLAGPSAGGKSTFLRLC